MNPRPTQIASGKSGRPSARLRLFPLGISCLVLALLAGCGGTDPPRTDVTEAAPKVRLLRLDVSLAGDLVRLDNLRMVEVPRASAPLDSLGGDLMLVSYSGGKVVQAMPFSIPTAVELESLGRAPQSQSTVPITNGSTSLFLDATQLLDRVEVLDGSGSIVASIGGADLAKPMQSFDFAKKRALGPQVAALTPARRLEAKFPHIHFLDASEGDQLSPRTKKDTYVYDLVSIDETMAQRLEEALDRVPQTALRAIRNVGVATMFEDCDSTSYGGEITLSTKTLEEKNYLSAVLVHEAVHAFMYLVDRQPGSRTAYSDEVLAAADTLMRRMWLYVGMVNAWAGIHATGLSLGLAGPYASPDQKDAPDVSIAEASGFATAYGSKNAREDMADYVMTLRVPEYREALVCNPIRAAGDPFPQELALPFAKIKLLEAATLVSGSDVSACVGNPSIQGPPGIHLGYSVHFTSNLKAGYLAQDGAEFLAVAGEATPYKFLLRVLAPLPNPQPLGMHRLDEIYWGNLNSANNAVYLAHDEEPLKARMSAGGLVLVTAANANTVEGAFFMLSLRGPAGTITDSFPMGTFLVQN